MKRPLVFAALLWILVLLLKTALGLPLYEEPPLFVSLQEEESREGTLTGTFRRISRTGSGFALELERAVFRQAEEETDAGTVLVYVNEAPSAPLGSRLGCRGSIGRFAAADNPGEFDARAFYGAQNLFCRMQAEQCTLIGTDRKMPVAEAARQTAEVFRARLLRLFPEEEAGLFCAVLLGDKSLLSAEIKADFSAAGTSHLLALSGLHVSLCAGGISLVFGWFLSFLPWESMNASLKGRGFLLFRSLLSGAAVYFYLLLAGSGVSLKRAAVLFLILLSASALGKSYDLPSALAAAALIILIPYPGQLFQAAFQLSFGSAFAIGCVYPPLCRRFCLETPLGKALLLPAVLQLFLLPLTLLHYYEFHPWSVPVNLLAIPLTGWVIPLGFAAVILAGLWFPLGLVAAGPACLSAKLLLFFCRQAARLPGHTVVCGRPALGRILLYYAAAALGLSLLLLYRKKKEKALRTLLDRAGESAVKRYVREGRQGIAAVILLYLSLSLLFLLPARGELTLTSLYVAQGDCHVITNRTGQCLIIDGGSSYGSPAEKHILPYLKYRGIRRIGAICVSHCDEDHINGLAEILEADGLKTDLLLIPAANAADPAAQPLLQAAERSGTAVQFLVRGDGFTAGDLRMTVLYPGPSPAAADNDNSLVLRVEEGSFAALYTGDLSGEKEEELLRLCPEELDGICLLKVAHHGSRHSSSEAFLDRVRPAAAVVSCGRRNVYGHPAEETRARFAARGIPLYRTDRMGAVSFTVQPSGEVSVSFFRKGYGAERTGFKNAALHGNSACT